MFVDGGYYHLIARGNNRLFIFEVAEGFEFFKDLLKRSKERYGWKLSHYCLMSNHFHLLGQLEKGDDTLKV
jgi:putative transposase